MTHTHYWTPNFSGTEEMCECGTTKDATTGRVQALFVEVWRGRTSVAGTCGWCGTGIAPDEERSKVWESGMRKKPKGRNGPGAYVHTRHLKDPTRRIKLLEKT